MPAISNETVEVSPCRAMRASSGIAQAFGADAGGFVAEGDKRA
jgi:hypothetical protein